MSAIDRSYTTQELAEMYGVSVQTVNRWIRKACKLEGVDSSAFGKADPGDGRIRTFSEHDVQIIEKHNPAQRVKPAVVEAEIVDAAEVTSIQTYATGVFDGSRLKPASLAISRIDDSELTSQSKEFDASRGKSLEALGAFLKQDAMNIFVQVIAENRHAIKGFAALAVNEAIESVAQPGKKRKSS